MDVPDHTNASIDWPTVKGIALGAITVLPERDPNTGRPRHNADGSPRTFPATHSLIWIICTLTRWHGFDWSAFDPRHPETFLTDHVCRRILHAAFNQPATEKILPEFAVAAFPRVSTYEGVAP